MNSKSVFAALLALSAVVLLLNNKTANQNLQFDQWKLQHKIQYESQFQNWYRRRVFNENKEKINTHNKDKTQTYEMGLNQFSAMTSEQFRKQYLHEIPLQTLSLTSDSQMSQDYQFSQDSDVDWTQRGAVGPVKNQGQCGADYAFIVTGPLQGLSKIADGVLRSFSEQQLIDCTSSSPYGNHGCNGGSVSKAFQFVADHGICTTEQYPYSGRFGTCARKDGSFKISQYNSVLGCAGLASVIHVGPVSVLVDATNWSPYKSGVFSNCGTQLNHGGTLVAYVQGIWKVKNSWGASWGENGFIQLAAGNTCGVCNFGTIPIK